MDISNTLLKAWEKEQKISFAYKKDDFILHYHAVPLLVNIDSFKAGIDGNIEEFYFSNVIAVENNNQE